ncbi:hypothetical protein, partial [Haemophilus parainfluenzae]|uniref:hypothetical protein n=1 Tax=Haemophilus parainfluenzae TaxID=729 RepID=UPI001CEC35AC
NQPKNIVILSSQLAVPDELGESVTVLEFKLPTLEEIQGEVQQLLQATRQAMPMAVVDEIARSCQGLSIERIRRVLARAIATH